MKLFDTSVLIDARDSASPFQAWAEAAIAKAVSTEGGAVNAVALAEAGVRSDAPAKLPGMLESWGLELLPLPVSAAQPAAAAYRTYLDRRKAAGTPTDAKMPQPDFFIGAHAAAEGLTLVTRDPARINRIFPALLSRHLSKPCPP